MTMMNAKKMYRVVEREVVQRVYYVEYGEDMNCLIEPEKTVRSKADAQEYVDMNCPEADNPWGDHVDYLASKVEIVHCDKYGNEVEE